MLRKVVLVALGVSLCFGGAVSAQEIEINAQGFVSGVDFGITSFGPQVLRDVTPGESMSLSIVFNFRDTPMTTATKVSAVIPMRITMDIGGRQASGTSTLALTVGSDITNGQAGAGILFSQFPTINPGSGFPTTSNTVLYQSGGMFEAYSLFAGVPGDAMPDMLSFLTSVTHAGTFLSIEEVLETNLPSSTTSLFLPLAYGVAQMTPSGSVLGLSFIRGELTSVSMGIVPAPGGVVFGAVVLPWMSRRRRSV
jgi:hypothetical protein